MEEFIHRENNILYQAVLEDREITWPKRCRNCDREFTAEETTQVCQSAVKNPLLDLLKVVSETLQTSRPKIEYCCINNLRPVIHRASPSEKIGNCSGVKDVFVEEGLVEWYGLSWEGDEDNDDTTDHNTGDTEPLFSFFQIQT
jgi:hypothetical protein